MATRSHPRTHPLDAASLVDAFVGLLDGEDGVDQLVLGIEAHPEHLDVHVAPLPEDDRAGAAGLFGMVAEPTWVAVGATFSGRARHLDTLDHVGGAEALVIVDRDGAVASALHVDGRLGGKSVAEVAMQKIRSASGRSISTKLTAPCVTTP